MVYVVGVKTRAHSLEEGKAAAHQNATAQVSSVVGTYVRSEFEGRSETGAEEYARERVDALTKAYIQNLVVEGEYWEKSTKIVGSYYEESFDVWVLTSFPRTAADEERTRQAKELEETGQDAYRRYSDAVKAADRGAPREAWLLLAQARKLLEQVPAMTDLHLPSFEKVADLRRAIDTRLQGLDELARGIRVSLSPKNDVAEKARSNLTSHLSAALGKSRLSLHAEGKARFLIDLEYTGRVPEKRVMGQRVTYITYASNVRDTWSSKNLPSSSGEVRGFGRSPDGALDEATREASERISKALGEALEALLKEETRGEK